MASRALWLGGEAGRRGLSLLMLACVWALTLRALWTDWLVDPQYHYGFLVPLLCLMLLYQRWQERSLPGREARGMEVAGLIPVLLVAAAIVFYPANPDWRLLGGVSAFSAVWLTLLWVGKMGGWNWIRHYGFAVAFFLIAVPWPRGFEARIMKQLMNFNASAALEIVRLAGYEAYRRGNLIELPTGLLGVEEACSGIRSLQGTLMAALCFGELFRLRTSVRLGLVVFGFAVALAGNVIRTSFLTVTASIQGVDAVSKWHDSAGLMTLLVSTGALWVAANFLSRWNRPRPTVPVTTAVSDRVIRSLSPALALTAIGIWAATFAGTEWWFRRHDAAEAALPAWRIEAPERLKETERMEIPEATARMLRYDVGMSGRWVDEDGLLWQYFFFTWDRRNAAQVAALHDPRVCLTSMGLEMEEQMPLQSLPAMGGELSFRTFRFRDRGLPVHVFQAVTNDRGLSEAQEEIGPDVLRANRWLAVERGRRFQGRRIVEVAVWGTESLAEAKAGLRRFLDRALVEVEGSETAAHR